MAATKNQIKKINLQISPDWYIQIPAIKTWKSLLVQQNWQHITYRLSNGLAIFLLAILFVTILMSTNIHYNIGNENITHSWQLAGAASIIIALGFVSLWQVMAVGAKRIVDPPAFIGVLIFSLTSILVWILGPLLVGVSSQLEGAVRGFNTFGATGDSMPGPILASKPLAGLGVIVMVGLFYVLNVLLDKRKKILWAVGVLYSFLAVGTLIAILFPQDFNLHTLLLINGFTVVTSWALTFTPHKIKGRLVFLALLAISAFSFLLVDEQIVWKILVSVIFGLLGWLWFRLLAKNFSIKIGFADWRKQLIKVARRQQSIESLLDFELVNLLVVVVLLVVELIAWVLLYQHNVGADILAILKDISIFFADAGDNLAQILFGLQQGAITTPVTTSVFVLTHQGLIGVAAYVILAVTFVIIPAKQLMKENIVAMLLFPVISTGLMMGLLLQLDLVAMIVIWFAFSVIIASLYLKQRKKLAIIQHKGWQIVRLLVAVGLFVVWFMAQRNLYDLVLNGTI